MRRILSRRDLTNPGLPGFARFWGSGFSDSGLEGQTAQVAVYPRILPKDFLQESFANFRALRPASPAADGTTFLKESYRQAGRHELLDFPARKFFATAAAGNARGIEPETFLKESSQPFALPWGEEFPTGKHRDPLSQSIDERVRPRDFLQESFPRASGNPLRRGGRIMHLPE